MHLTKSLPMISLYFGQFGEESSELYFEVHGTSKWWSAADGWGQGFVISKEVWDEILGELSAF